MAAGLATWYVAATVTTPAGTPIAAPLSTPVQLGNVTLLNAHLRVPDGHAGFTGVRIDYSQRTILPFSNPSAWIIDDGVERDYLIGLEVGNTLAIVTYNTDVYDHVHYWTFQVTTTDSDTRLQPVQLVNVTP